MSYPAKIQLSETEMQLVTNSDWIFAKQEIIKKIYALFGELNEAMKKRLAAHPYLPTEATTGIGKITKGENYLGLPYVILDQPSLFSKNDILAIRTMFWWGNYFSITLHVSGKYKEMLSDNYEGALRFLQERDFLICINKDEWEHHFDRDNYKPAKAVTVEELQITGSDFFKTGKTIPLTSWDNALPVLLIYFEEIIEFLCLKK